MKKFLKFKLLILLALSTILFAFLFGCSKNVDYTPYVSQLRLSVYQGSSQNFKVTAYAEKRETPFIPNGTVSELINAVIVKVEFLNGSPSDANLKLFYGEKSITAPLTYNPVSEKSTATIKVENLPSSPSITVEITSGEILEKLTLSSVIFDKTISYQEAINQAINADKELSSKLFKAEVSAEINVRIIVGDGKNYYYVGLIDKLGNTTAYLIDGETGSVLAKRSFKA